MQHAVEKTFLVVQPVQPVALTSGGHNRRKPAGDGAKRHPPEGRSAQRPLALKGAK